MVYDQTLFVLFESSIFRKKILPSKIKNILKDIVNIFIKMGWDAIIGREK